MQFGDRQIRNGREKSQDFLTYDEKSLWTLLSNMFNVSVMKDIFVWMEDGDKANLTVKCDTFLKKKSFCCWENLNRGLRLCGGWKW